MNTVPYTVRKSKRSKSLRVSVYCDGRVIVAAPPFLGLETVDRFVAQKSEWISKTLQKFMPFRPIVRRKNSRREYIKHREAARELVVRRIAELNQAYSFKVGRISIRNQKSRWGSCSAEGNLSFNYRLALIPLHLADYVIVHELCHIGELNHSKRFWDLVGKKLPHYRALRKELHSHPLLSL